jgi:hypothetical protein
MSTTPSPLDSFDQYYLMIGSRPLTGCASIPRFMLYPPHDYYGCLCLLVVKLDGTHKYFDVTLTERQFKKLSDNLQIYMRQRNRKPLRFPRLITRLNLFAKAARRRVVSAVLEFEKFETVIKSVRSGFHLNQMMPFVYEGSIPDYLVADYCGMINFCISPDGNNIGYSFIDVAFTEQQLLILISVIEAYLSYSSKYPPITQRPSGPPLTPDGF